MNIKKDPILRSVTSSKSQRDQNKQMTHNKFSFSILSSPFVLGGDLILTSFHIFFLTYSLSHYSSTLLFLNLGRSSYPKSRAVIPGTFSYHIVY